LPSNCILMYSFNDHVRLLKLFRGDNEKSKSFGEYRLQSLYQMLSYCENVTVCRRKLLVEHFGEFYDSETCKNSLSPCSICEFIKKNGASPYKAYDFTEEAVIVLRSIQSMKEVTLNVVTDLYRGVGKKSKNENNANLPLFGRGEGCHEDDIHRFMRKLLIEGYLVETLKKPTGIAFEVCYVSVSAAGNKFISDSKRPKIYSHLMVKNRKESKLYEMNTVSEAAVLKEKYKLKHFHVFVEAKREFIRLFIAITRDEKIADPYGIISMPGIEQLAATLPRTNSELLQIDSMTTHKLEIYGPKIMPLLQTFWDKIDKLEHEKITHLVGKF